MGTSSSHGGPKGKNPLLPQDFDDNGSQPDDDNKKPALPEGEKTPQTELWKNAKTNLSKYIRSSDSSSGGFKRALSSYVTAHGGGGGAASTASSGKSTTVSLGSFLSGVSSEGMQNTLARYDIEYEGRSAEEVLGDLVNQIAPVPDTKEDSVARNALLDAIEELYEKISENDGDLSALDDMDESTFNDVMGTYISSYIFQRFLSELEKRFEMYAETQSALELEQDIKEYIHGVVENKLDEETLSELDYSSDSINGIIDEIYSDCYDVVEEAL